MKQSERPSNEKGGAPQDAWIYAEKQVLLKIIKESKNEYFIHAVLTYARCLDRALNK